MGAMCRILTEVTPLDLKYNTTGNTDTMIDQSRETALTFVERHQTEFGIIYPDPTKYKIVNQFLPVNLIKFKLMELKSVYFSRLCQRKDSAAELVLLQRLFLI